MKLPLQAPAVSRRGSDSRIAAHPGGGIAPLRKPINTKHLAGEPAPKGKVQHVYCDPDAPTRSRWCFCSGSRDYVCCEKSIDCNTCCTG